MISPIIIIAATFLYFAMMFFVAHYVEQKAAKGVFLTHNAFVYTLGLTIYLTTWMFYGNVGLAATKGYYFLAPYIGNSIFCLFWFEMFRRLLRIKNTFNITSVADFISVRYDKSSFLAALITIVILIGIIPYLALQIIAVLKSYTLITTGSTVAGIGTFYTNLSILALIILFIIIFSFRKLDQLQQQPGMIMVVAIQSIIKFITFLLAGIFVTYFMYDGFWDLFAKMRVSTVLPLIQSNPSYSQWMSYLIVSIFAIIVLPRQFYVGVVENVNARHIRTAIWLLPLILFLSNFFVYPIAVGGILHGYDVKLADVFTLLLPLKEGSPFLAFAVFIGGLSAAMSMIIVSTITITSMTTNHLIVPLIENVRPLHFLRRYLLQLRWFVVSALLIFSYWFSFAVGSTFILVKIGILSFAAIFQLTPSFLGSLYWKRGNKHGAILGIGAGFAVWIYTALIPAFVRSGWIPNSLLTEGPYGIAFLRPENLFGISTLDPLAVTLLFSFLLNVGCYILGSLLFEQSEEEKHIAAQYIGGLKEEPVLAICDTEHTQILLHEKTATMMQIFSQYVSIGDARDLTDESLRETDLSGKEFITIYQLMSLNNVIEKKLARYISAPSAKGVLLHSGLVTAKEMNDFTCVHREIGAISEVSSQDSKQAMDSRIAMEKIFKEQSQQLEMAVADRTKKLEEANAELKQINNLTIDRELRMIELKERIKVLELQIKEFEQKIGAQTAKTLD